MSEQEDFFSPKHKQLLSIAIWAKYLAWGALVAFIFIAIANVIGEINIYNSFNTQINSIGQPIKGFADFFKTFPGEAIKSLFKSISIFVTGVVYYLVLKGISLGLNMIVETDINYREKENQGRQQ